MVMLRKAVLPVLLLVAVVFFMGPLVVGSTVAVTNGYEDAISAVTAEDVLNNTRTEGAPQQQVVNGWTARDLLIVNAKQNNDMLELQYRQLALLLVIALLLGWSVVSQREDYRAAGAMPDPVRTREPTTTTELAAATTPVAVQSPPVGATPTAASAPIPPPPGAEGR